MQLSASARKFRDFASKPQDYRLTEALFLRLLGLVYLAAFASFWPQMDGLFGMRGIVPVSRVLTAIHNEMGASAFYQVPTLFWVNSSDAAMVWCCIVGCLSGLLLVAGVFSRAASIVCWILYLSIVSVGEPFTSFQWDALLLEAGFLALFAGSAWLVWAYRVLLFRLMFESGLVKFLSGDPNWRNLHALRFHFMTQPLPNPIAYYAYRLPPGTLDFMTAATLAIESLAPFLLFCPRRLRQIGVAFLMFLQLLIIFTGNYAFFNLLTLALCLWGLDDRTFVPIASLLQKTFPRASSPANANRFTSVRAASNVILVLVTFLGVLQLLDMVHPAAFRFTRKPFAAIAPLEIVNSYGLFASMTTTRPELVIEGSNDQVNWREYSFRYKPGELHRGLPQIAPYQPRLDWQMWFAALGDIQENPWVKNLLYRILTGEPSVTGLLEPPPFTTHPQYLRVLLYDYDFTTPGERERTGAVWKRTFRGIWFGPVSLTGH
ncbi:MAG TPA: lipase maturation factor family protein [Bryobacteraceae bacterium]|nr:lipase maturation factor family protein [Bryobacteraceae bacterium]